MNCGDTGIIPCKFCTGSGRVGNVEFWASGTSAKDVAAILKVHVENLKKVGEYMPMSPKTVINLNNSTIGILNTGEIEDVQAISVNVTTLLKTGEVEVATALKRLTKAVAENREISTEERAYLLENLEELSKQAVLPPADRAKSGVIKSMLSGIAMSLGAAGGTAEVWSTWGNAIRSYFGV